MKLRLGVFALMALATFFNPAEPLAQFGSFAYISLLDEPQGLRNVGMGTTGVADMHRNTNGYYNPASLAFNDRTWLSFSYQQFARDWIDAEIDFTDTRATFGHGFEPSGENSWRVGGLIGYTTNHVEAVERTIFFPEGVGTANYLDYYLTGGLAACYQQGRQSFALGASLKYLDLASAGAHTWLFDYGAIAALTYEVGGAKIRPRVGISSINHDSGIELDGIDYDIIGHWRIGGGVDIEATKGVVWGREVAAAAASIDFERVSVDESRGPYWSIGWEGSMIELVHLRAGYQWYEVESRSTLCLGAGLGWEFSGVAIQLDYARFSPAPSGFVDQDMFGATVGARF